SLSSSALLCFFSSRRRHTRFSRDWSSDVCSSDLPEQACNAVEQRGPLQQCTGVFGQKLPAHIFVARLIRMCVEGNAQHASRPRRSEERRVGIECRCRGLVCDEANIDCQSTCTGTD